MKKIIVFALALLLMGGVAYGALGDYIHGLGGSETPGYRVSPGPGTRVLSGGTQDVPTKTFRLVRYVPVTTTDAVLSKDSIVIWNDDYVSGDDGVTVTTSITSYDSRVAGIIATRARTLSPDRAVYTGASRDRGMQNWTWLQTYGLGEVRMGSDSTAAAGSALGISSTAGGAVAFVDGANTLLCGNAGVFLDSGAVGEAGVLVFIRCE